MLMFFFAIKKNKDRIIVLLLLKTCRKIMINKCSLTAANLGLNNNLMCDTILS